MKSMYTLIELLLESTDNNYFSSGDLLECLEKLSHDQVLQRLSTHQSPY